MATHDRQTLAFMLLRRALCWPPLPADLSERPPLPTDLSCGLQWGHGPASLPACRVMLESFISTQKTSVQKAMTKRFRHYLSHAQDLNDLILHALQVDTGLRHSDIHVLG